MEKRMQELEKMVELQEKTIRCLIDVNQSSYRMGNDSFRQRLVSSRG